MMQMYASAWLLLRRSNIIVFVLEWWEYRHNSQITLMEE